MKRGMIVVAFFGLLCPLFAQDGIFVDKELEIRFSVPDETFTIRTEKFEFYTNEWGKATVAEFFNKNEAVRGILARWALGEKIDKFVSIRESETKGDSRVKNPKVVKTEKITKKKGDWVLREWTWEGTYKYHLVVLYGANGDYNIELHLWVTEGLWEKYKDLMYKIVSSLECGEEPPPKDK